MYVYYRQCHKSLKPAAVFPIEVELGIDLQTLSSQYREGTHDVSSESHNQVEDEHPNSEENIKSEEELLDLLLPDVPPPTPALPAAEEDKRSEVDRILAQLQEPEQ